MIKLHSYTPLDEFNNSLAYCEELKSQSRTTEDKLNYCIASYDLISQETSFNTKRARKHVERHLICTRTHNRLISILTDCYNTLKAIDKIPQSLSDKDIRAAKRTFIRSDKTSCQQRAIPHLICEILPFIINPAER